MVRRLRRGQDWQVGGHQAGRRPARVRPATYPTRAVPCVAEAGARQAPWPPWRIQMTDGAGGRAGGNRPAGDRLMRTVCW